jgi:U3 small nucleolar RNA-associated protein 25
MTAVLQRDNSEAPAKKKRNRAAFKEDDSPLVAENDVIPVGDSLEEGAEAESGSVSLLDSGYTRPRVLILCPFRAHARRLVEALISALGADSTSVSGHEKFLEEFGRPSDEELNGDDKNSESGEEGEAGSKRKTQARPNKPSDWKVSFEDNTDDDFKMGIQLTPGQGKGSGVQKGALLRLYSDFFLSDIIVGSPLGLKLVVTSKENMAYDFLSSLEMVIVHQADVLYMQNWDHVTEIMKNVNTMPVANHDTDFSRVRPYFLDGKAAEHRQLIVTSSFNDPLIWGMFREHSRSIAGRIRLKQRWGDSGCLGLVTTRVKQLFQLVPCAEPAAQEEARFEYFKKNVLGPILRLNQQRTLIVAPSYFSYVRIRNELLRQEVSNCLSLLARC